MRQDKETYAIGQILRERIKSASQLHHLDTRLSAERLLCEEIARGFQQHLSCPFVIKGGLIHDQRKRQTGDLDIQFLRRLDVSEVHRAFDAMAADLARKGLHLDSTSDEPEILDINGSIGMRFRVRAYAGDMRIDTHIDMSFRGSFPKRVPQRTLPTFIKGQEPLVAHVQETETQIAEKMVSILRMSGDSTRLKDMYDIAKFAADNLDHDLLADEMMRVATSREPGLDLDRLFLEVPEALSFDVVDRHEAAWIRLKETGKIRADLIEFIDVICDCRHVYDEARKRVWSRLGIIEEKPTMTLRQARIAAQRVIDRERRVVSIDAYRAPQTLPAR